MSKRKHLIPMALCVALVILGIFVPRLLLRQKERKLLRFTGGSGTREVSVYQGTDSILARHLRELNSTIALEFQKDELSSRCILEPKSQNLVDTELPADTARQKAQAFLLEMGENLGDSATMTDWDDIQSISEIDVSLYYWEENRTLALWNVLTRTDEILLDAVSGVPLVCWVNLRTPEKTAADEAEIYTAAAKTFNNLYGETLQLRLPERAQLNFLSDGEKILGGRSGMWYLMVSMNDRNTAVIRLIPEQT